MSPKYLYSEDDLKQLERDLEDAAGSMGNRDYSRYIFTTLREMMAFDSGWLGIAKVEGQKKVKIEECFCYNQPRDKIVKNYNKYYSYDPLVLKLMQSPSVTVINSDEVQYYDEYVESDIFRYHGSSYDIHHTLATTSRLGHSNQALFLSFYNAEPKGFFNHQTLALVEKISVPLFYIWKGKLGYYHQKAAIEIKDYQLASIAQLTQTELDIMYMIAKSRKPLTAFELGKRLYKSKKRVENQLTSIYQKLYIGGKQNEKKLILLTLSQQLLESSAEFFGRSE
jgi:DNA-binding CsgD family transcriptional regulator